MISSFEDSVQIFDSESIETGSETTLVSDGRCEVQSHCATREKFSRPNQWIQEKENDQKNKIRGGAQNYVEAIFF